MNEFMKHPIEKFSHFLESIDSIPVTCDSLFGNNFENHDVVDCESLKYHLFDEYAFDTKTFFVNMTTHMFSRKMFLLRKIIT